MKYIESKKISPRKYILTIEVSEYDMNMIEDLATTYAPFKLYDDNKHKFPFDFSPCEFNDKYYKWTNKMWSVFWELWHKHDEFN